MDINRFFCLGAGGVRRAFLHQGGIWHVPYEAMGRIGTEQDRLGVHGSTRFFCNVGALVAEWDRGEGASFPFFSAFRVALFPTFVRLSALAEGKEPDAGGDSLDGSCI